MGAGPLVFLIAGEPSGDLLAGRLMTALSRKIPDVRFAGVGGDAMTEVGLSSQFPMSDLTVMGIAEVLPHLPLLLRRIRETAEAIRQTNPDLIITVDAPDFSFRVMKKVSDLNIPKVHYVAPTVWAWRPKRAKKVAQLYDHLLCLLPFEPPYFEREGMDASFVGHSAVELPEQGDAERFRKQHDLNPDDPLLCVLPGSRNGEVARLLPVFEQTVKRLAVKYERLRIVVPTVGKVRDSVEQGISAWPGNPILVTQMSEKSDAFVASTASLAASGTVSLELAISGVPHVVAYRLAPLSYFVAKLLVKVPHVALVNLVLERRLIPEFIQHECRPEHLVPVIDDLLSRGEAWQAQIDGFEQGLVKLGQGGPAPSERAAEVVAALLAQVKTSTL